MVRNVIHSLLRRADSRGSADIIYHMSLLCRSDIVLTSKSRSHTEYLMTTDNNTVIVGYSNLTKKCKSDWQATSIYDLTRYCLKLFTFLGPV